MKTHTFRWLHFSDLHVGQKDTQHDWPNLCVRLLADLEERYRRDQGRRPWDVLFFTGDLTYSGVEFEALDECLGQIMGGIERLQGQAPRLIAIPGNHDLRWPADPEVPKLMRLWHTPELQATRRRFWDAPSSGLYGEAIREVFAGYMKWWTPWGAKLADWEYHAGAIPGDFSLRIPVGDRKIGVVGLNSSFLQMGPAAGQSYEGALELHPAQFNAIHPKLGPFWVKEQDLNFLLTHHPPSWLNSESYKNAYEATIYRPDNFFAHLFGHAHENRQRERSDGGSDARRLYQSASLFGLEVYATAEGATKDRIHGYALGAIEFEPGDDSFDHMTWQRRYEDKVSGSRDFSDERGTDQGKPKSQRFYRSAAPTSDSTKPVSAPTPPLAAPIIARSEPRPAPGGAPAKVLVLARDSEGSSGGREMAAIRRALEVSSQLEEVLEPAPKVIDIPKYLRTQPTLVHMTSHGKQRKRAGGPVALFYGENGRPADYRVGHFKAALAQYEEARRRDFPDAPKIRCVVLNMCFLGEWADELLEVVEIVIGTTKKIGDEAALAFARKFYYFLARGDSIGSSFDAAKTAIDSQYANDLILRSNSKPGEEKIEYQLYLTSSAPKPLPLPPSASKLPATLREGLAQSKVVPFVGPLLSPHPGLADLLKLAAAKLTDNDRPHGEGIRRYLEEYRPPKYARAVTEAQEGFKGTWASFLEEVYQDNSGEPSASLRSLWNIADQLIITTTHDRQLVYACPSKGCEQWSIEPKDPLKPRRETVWYLNGQVLEPQDILLQTEVSAKLEDPRHPYGRALQELQRLMRENHLLFVGYGGADELPLAQLRWLRDKDDMWIRHYVLVSDDDEPRTRRVVMDEGLDSFLQILRMSDFGGEFDATLSLFESVRQSSGS